jgi:murein DD-endopeptidase MepM/ murein hydrolase activator NlpD
MTRGITCLLSAVLVGTSPAIAQHQAPGAEIDWIPSEPRQGTIVQIVVRPHAAAGPTSFRGTLAGQALHFERGMDGRYRALGGIPIGTDGSLPLMLELTFGDGSTEEPFVRIPVTAGEFATERLSVAPRFTERPDSSLEARISRERARARALSNASHDTPRLWTGAFRAPVSGRVTSRYGKGREFNGQLQSRHMGVDLAGNPGDSVTAPNHAVVALADEFYYAGNVVYLDHGRGLVTAYMHLSELLVAAGDTVVPGQVIGRVGATGRVTGPHLHWLARYGPITIDALSLFEADLDLFDDHPRQ